MMWRGWRAWTPTVLVLHRHRIACSSTQNCPKPATECHILIPRSWKYGAFSIRALGNVIHTLQLVHVHSPFDSTTGSVLSPGTGSTDFVFGHNLPLDSQLGQLHSWTAGQSTWTSDWTFRTRPEAKGFQQMVADAPQWRFVHVGMLRSTGRPTAADTCHDAVQNTSGSGVDGSRGSAKATVWYDAEDNVAGGMRPRVM